MRKSRGELEALIDLMAKLPGLGPRSARRAVLHLVTKRVELMTPLARAMDHVAHSARFCAECRNITTVDTCDICRDPKRQTDVLCVVQDVSDLWAMERSNAYRGRYFVLGGTLSALDAIGPEDLGIPDLIARLHAEPVEEVIIALPATIEGQTTAHYISSELPEGITSSTLAQGIPIGGELDYLDEGTITAALSARKSV